jgi:hypothetical protein
MKWYMAVRANCQRDKSTSISVGSANMEKLLGSSFLQAVGFLLAKTLKTAFIRLGPSDSFIQLVNT